MTLQQRRLIERHLPKKLHKMSSMVVGVVAARLEWMSPDDQEEALIYACALLVQAERDRKPYYSEAQFVSFAKLRMLRLIRPFLSEIRERQRQNAARWAAKNARTRHKRQEWRERQQARHDATSSNTSPSVPINQNLGALLRYPTQDEQYLLQLPYGSELTLYEAYDGSREVIAAARLTPSMRPVDKLRLLLLPRERELLKRMEDGETLAAIAKDWNISRPRATQLRRQALDRLKKYLLRLRAGTSFATLRHEAAQTIAIAKKKQKNSATWSEPLNKGAYQM